MAQLTPRETQKVLRMGPFSGSDLYIMLVTEDAATFEAATFGFKGKMVEIHSPQDVAREITDQEAILIRNGDELLTGRAGLAAVEAFLKDQQDQRHRNLVVVSVSQPEDIPEALRNRFLIVKCLPPVLG